MRTVVLRGGSGLRRLADVTPPTTCSTAIRPTLIYVNNVIKGKLLESAVLQQQVSSKSKATTPTNP